MMEVVEQSDPKGAFLLLLFVLNTMMSEKTKLCNLQHTVLCQATRTIPSTGLLGLYFGTSSIKKKKKKKRKIQSASRW